MSDVSIQYCTSGTKNIVRVAVWLESGCDIKKEEYGLTIEGFIGQFNIKPRGGEDEVSLIKECADEFVSNIDFDIPEEGVIYLNMVESGEWQDVFYTKWYEVVSFTVQEF